MLLAVDPDEPPQSLSLDGRKNLHDEGQSSPTSLRRPESKYLRNFQMALLFACTTALLIPIRAYNPSHSRPASQDIFSSLCFPTVSRLRLIINNHQSSSCSSHKNKQSSSLLPLHLPNILTDPPAIVFITSILAFFTLIFSLHDIRQADIYQNQISSFGIICGSILCGVMAFRRKNEEGVSAAFKNLMPGIILATLAASAMIHTFLVKKK